MTTLNSLDKKYVVIRDGVEFYYFGDGCIADYFGNSIAYLDETEINIVMLCNGKNTIASIVNNLQPQPAEAIQLHIKCLYKKGVLNYSDKGIDKKISFHGEKGTYFPKELVIELTNTCNYSCPFCYKNANNRGEFITDECITRIDKLVRNKINHILLTGGEPTLHPNYLEYISIFAKYAKVHMISNGSVLFDHDSRNLQKLDLIQFTIYGCDDEEYQKMTGAKDGFTRLCKSIEFAKKNDINIKAAVTLCDKTIDHIEAFVETVINLGFRTMRIGLADVFGRGAYLFGSSNDFPTQRNIAFDRILELKRKYRNKISFELPNINIEHVTDHQDIKTNIYRDSLICGCGSEYLIVSQAGEIRPCQMLPEKWFSVKDKYALEKHIKGDFHINQLKESVKRYYADNEFDMKEISPCRALEEFVARRYLIDD